MKTPEEMAKEWANQEVPQYHHIDCTPMDRYAHKKAERGFLAGYKAAQQWISVKDRLPEMYEEVIVAVPFVFEDENGPTNQKGCAVGTSRLVEDPQGAKWNIHIEEKWVNHITHWMPLPAPPKEDK